MSKASLQSSPSLMPPRGRPLLRVLVLLVLLGCLSSVGGAAGTEALRPDPEALAREITSDGSYQTELPGLVGEIPRGASRTWSLGPLPRLVSTSLLVALAGIGFVWGWQAFFGAGRVAQRVRETRVNRTFGQELAPRREEPERLAAQGLYDEAIHALLLLAIGAIARRPGGAAPRGLTSRELLRALPLDQAAAHALAALVTAVELTRFGGAAALEADYVRCLTCYRATTGEEPS